MVDDTLSTCLAEIKANKGRFYVYILSKPSGMPFYVGCGSVQTQGRQRIAFHEYEAKSVRTSHKCNTIREIWRHGGEVIYSIDSWYDSAPEMFAREIFLIAQIGRSDLKRGPLTNWSDGGEGLVNRSKEVRARASASMRARVTPELRREFSAHTAAHWASEDGRAKRIAANSCPETKARRKAASTSSNARADVKEAKRRAGILLWGREDYRIRQNAALRKAVAEQEYRDKQSKNALKRWADPEYRERLKETHRKRWTDELRRGVSEKMTVIKGTEESRAKNAQSARLRWSDPLYKERVRKSMKDSWAERRTQRAERA